MQKVFEIVEKMLSDGVIDAYALGGAQAALIYIEPFSTIDFDFFVQIASADTSPLDPLRSIIEYLRQEGYSASGVEFDIEGIPVQFIPFYDELTQEATMQADTMDFGGYHGKVISPEYLVAIMLKTNRLKDRVRARMFLDQGKVDLDQLQVLIERFDLNDQWQKVLKM